MQLVRAHLCRRLPELELLWSAPTLSELNALAERHDCPVRFAAQEAGSAADYEHQVFRQRLVPTRIEQWHDRLNAAMWLLWPSSKLALNAAHIDDLERNPGRNRSRRRDALTLLDEAGIVIVSSDPSTREFNRAHDWRELFVAQREQWFNTIQPLLLGHGLAEQCLQPYLGLTGKACHLQLPADQLPADQLRADQLDALGATRRIDQMLADWIDASLSSPDRLLPLPVLGIPGWHQDNDRAAFYANRDYFRPRRSR